MPVDAFGILALFSITIIIGYLGTLIFKRTGISDVIWLLLLGLLLGTQPNLIQKSIFLEVLPLISAVALIIILFDAGLNMDFYKVVKGFSRGMLLSIVGFVLSTVTIALAAMLLFGFDGLQGLLLGSILGDISAAVIVGLVNKIPIRENIKTVLSLESVLTNPFTIVIPIIILNIMTTTTQVDILSPLSSIVSVFSVSVVFGLVFGVFWQVFTDRIKEKHLEYMLTIAVMFIMYIIVEWVGSTGAIAALVFGLIIGNKSTIFKIFKIKERSRIQHESLKITQTEVSFFIRSFFFVYLGLIVSVNSGFILSGIAIVAVIIITRLGVTEIATFRMDIWKNEKNITRIIVSRGLSTAVVSSLPLLYGIPKADIYQSIAFIVILGTTLYTVAMSAFLTRPKNHDAEKARKHAKKTNTKGNSAKKTQKSEDKYLTIKNTRPVSGRPKKGAVRQPHVPI